MQIYPNPVQGRTTNLTLQANEPGKVSLFIYNGIGRILSFQTFIANIGENTFPLQVPKLKKGVYYVRLFLGSTNEMERLIILE
jgi:hypothetical protein